MINKVLNFIICLVSITILSFIVKFFEKRKDNKFLSTIYMILKVIAGIFVLIVTGLLYWAGIGYLMESNYKTGIMLLVFGFLMTASLLGKWYISAKKSDK